MGGFSRRKGKNGERELSHELNALGFETHRGQQYNGSDGSADVVGLPGIHIECKRVESFRMWDALEQAEHDAREGELPVVMHRRNGKPWVCVMDEDDFWAMYNYHGGPYCHFETVFKEKVRLYDELESAVGLAPRKDLPVLMFMRKGEKIPGGWEVLGKVAIMLLTDWADVYRAWRAEL